MWRRPAVTILNLFLLVMMPLPARARRNVGPSSVGPRPNAVRPYIARAALTDGATAAFETSPGIVPNTAKPFTQDQVISRVRDGFGDESGAKLIEQRGIDFDPSEDFIQTLKAAGASEAFLNALRATAAPGLSPAPADVAASSPRHGGVKPPLRDAALKGGSTIAGPPASATKPFNQVQVFALLVGQAPSHRVATLVPGTSLKRCTDGAY